MTKQKGNRDGISIDWVFDELNKVECKTRADGYRKVAELTGASRVKVMAIGHGNYTNRHPRPEMPNCENNTTTASPRALDKKSNIESLVSSRPWTTTGLKEAQ
jgi:hypothetical protein